MVEHHHFGRSSLLLASHDKAHREHVHQHHLLHRRGSSVVGEVVTEVIATLTVIQQVTVDSNGVTIGLHTYTADSTGGTAFPSTTTESATPATTPASPGTSSSGATASSTSLSGPGDQNANNAASSSQSLLSIQNIDSASAATPISSIPTTFTSILATNSSSVISASSATSLAPSFSNSSLSSTALSGSPSSSISINLLSSSSTISDESSSLLLTTSSVYSPSSSSSATATATNGVAGGGSGTGTGSGDASTSTAAAGSGNGSDSSPSTSTVVGGVVGGVAGAAILIFLLMFLIRWKRRHSSMLALGGGEGEETTGTSRSVPPSGPSGSGGMAERSSFGGFAVPAALASLTGYKRSSQRTADRATISSTAGSERGFYRVSGRKLPSVLQTGGDGYGGGIMDSNTLSGSSFYRDSQGYYGGPGTPSSPPVGLSMARDSGVPIMREGPARTPVTEQGPFADPPASFTPPPPRRPDVVGRSHPSFDGSQRSRFTEEV